jgi:hypothetical protein
MCCILLHKKGSRVSHGAFIRSKALLALLAVALLIGVGGGRAAMAQTPATNEPDLAAVKQYVVDQATAQKAATEQLLAIANRYYDLAQGAGFDYQVLWQTNTPETAGLVAAAKASWLEASTHYEMNEGLIAGIPSLSYYDVWIDAGPSGEEDPAGALDWTLELPNGTKLEKPGNIFHYLTEPLIWGTTESFVGLRLDIDGDGTQELGEVLPEANVFAASSKALDDATAQMQAAVNEWEPTIEDAFTALITMIPTMSEYFEQWKLSSFVTGETSTEASFVATSRLFDVNGIVGGLKLTYDEISPAVDQVDPALHTQIQTNFTDLVDYVANLYQQEASGTRFTPEQADLFGSEAQSKASTLTGQVSQAIALLGLQV